MRFDGPGSPSVSGAGRRVSLGAVCFPLVCMNLLRCFQFARLARSDRGGWYLAKFGQRFGRRRVSTMIRVALEREKRSVSLQLAGFPRRPRQHRLKQNGRRHGADQGEGHQLAHARQAWGW